MTRSCVVAVLALILPVVPVAGEESSIALVGATVHTADGPPLESATIVIRGDRIAAVGKVEPPAGAEIVDLTGRHVAPGYVSANTVLGLTEISAVDMTNDFQETGDLNPNARAEVAVNPDSELIPVARVNGVTSALVVPRGGDISGTSALIGLDGWTYEDLTRRAPVGLHVVWPRMTPQEGGFRPEPVEEQEKARDEAVERLSEAFATARAYWKARRAETEPGVPRHDRDVRWEAMGPALAGEIPVFVHASAENELRAALAFLVEQDIPKAVIVGGADAEAVADELKRRDIPVIIGATLRNPGRDSDPYDRAFTLPARLRAAGVRFCIADSGGSMEAANARNLPYHAAMAAAFGLSPEDALRAITRDAASILGVEEDVGSIQPGRLADLIVTDGHPLEITSSVEQVYISGRAIPMESRHTRLFERWRSRPRPAGPR
jgi:imidazolonepropionase-like amidohydrolase